MEIRKLETQEKREEKDRRRKKFWGIAVLLIMVLSTVGYAFLYNPNAGSSNAGSQNAQNEEGKAINIGNQWAATLGGEQFLFSSSPESAGNISVEIKADANLYYGKTLYIASDSKAISYEIASTIGKYASRTQDACYGPCNNSELPEKNCTDSLIVYNKAEENRVYQNESCVFIEGDIRGVDAFLYKILGIS